MERAEPTRRALSLRLSDGSRLRGDLLSLEDGKVKLREYVLGGQMTSTFELDEFDPRSQWRIRREEMQPETFEQHFELAKLASASDLLTEIGSSAEKAAKAARGREDEAERIAELHTFAADSLEERIRRASEDLNLKEARHFLRLLNTHVPEQRTDEQREELAQLVDSIADRKREARRSARQKRVDSRLLERLEKRLEAIDRLVDRGDAYYREALRKPNNTAQSSTRCEQAINTYIRAHKELQALLEKNPGDSGLARSATDTARHMHDNGLAAAMLAANLRATQGDYNGAIDWTDRILEFDPDNEEAKALGRELRQAKSSVTPWGWRWGVGGIALREGLRTR